MSFPHLNRNNGAAIRQTDFRALISNAISRQSSGVTMQLMSSAAQNRNGAPKQEPGAMIGRIRYFAARCPADAQGTPHGAFFPLNCLDFGHVTNYDQAVYQDSLANGKVDAVLGRTSDSQAIFPGQEN